LSMTRITLAYAAILILIGIIGYLGSGMVSFTALIPAFFGILMLVIGLLALNENRRKTVMHIASVLGLIGFLGTMGGIFDVSAMLSGQEIMRPGAAVSKALMAVMSLVYFLLCLWSFISVRLLKKKDYNKAADAKTS
jgi:multisubunit Na+/H+ antiporter MnhF subunit